MRSSFYRTLLFLLPVFLLLSCGGLQEQEQEIDSRNVISQMADTDGVIDQVPGGEASGNYFAQTADVRGETPDGTHPAAKAAPLQGGDLYPAHLQIALSYEGVTELTGQNDGPEIKKFLASVGLDEGYAYCAAFVSYCLAAADRGPMTVDRPEVRSALAYDFITDYSIEARKVVRGLAVPPGTILVWRKGDTIFGHAGFVVSWSGALGMTIEANTSSPAGSRRGVEAERDGEGVYVKQRTIQPGNYFRITHFTPVIYG